MMYNEIMDFAIWLKETIKDKKWSERELARKSGQSQSTVNDVIRGKRKPTRDFCVAIARALELSEAEVLFRADLLTDVSLGQLEPWIHNMVQESKSLTPAQRQHVIALIKMMQDGTIELVARPPDKE